MRRSRVSHLVDDADGDPMLSAINLVDVFLVALVILMVAVVHERRASAATSELLRGDEDFTLIKNPGADDMQIVVKNGETLERFDATGSSASGTGVAAGTAYRLRDGSMVYVPTEVDGNSPR